MNEEQTIKEIPITQVRSNQLGIVVTVAVAIIFQYPWLIATLWLVQALTRLLGSNANVFIVVFQPIIEMIYRSKETEAAELQKFNLSLGIFFLTVSLVSFSLGWTITGYVFAAFMGLAALMALFGFCVGCTIYYQYKKYKALKNRA